jgi:DNA polymerase-3 subunit epsilon
MKLLEALRSRTATADVPLGGFAALDLETTGLSTRTDRVVEVAVVCLDLKGKVVTEFSTLVNPQRDVGPTRIHGLRARDVAAAPRFADVAGQVLGYLAGRVPVAHNLSFDLRFLDAELGRLGTGLPAGFRGLCTMRMAGGYLDGLAGRTLAACCAAASVPLTQAHSALADARAVAGLMAVYGRCQSTFPSEWNDALHRASSARWPILPMTTVQPVTREVVVRRQAEPGYLARLVRRLPAAGVADPALDSYLAVLDQALEDRQLDPGEASALEELAESLGVCGADLERTHHGYLLALARAAWADGSVSETELADLRAVAQLLGLPADAVRQALDAARTAPQAGTAHASHERLLCVGMRVCFTGEMSLDRAELERRAVAAGLRVTGSVSGKTDVLVVADAASMSTKARRARELGIRVIAEPVFLNLLEQIEPVTGLPRSS